MIYQPLLNALVFLYDTVAFQDLGIAIVLLTVLIRLLLYPIFAKSITHQLVMQELQPKLKKIQEEHKKDLEKQSHATMALYKEHKVNPFSGMFFLIVQLPILFALYQIFLRGLTPESFQYLYSFVAHPDGAPGAFLGLINLQKPNIVIVVCAALAQYFQGKYALGAASTKELSPAEAMARRMVYAAPIITFVIFLQIPAAVGLYWLTTSVASIAQQWHVQRTRNTNERQGISKKTS